MKIEFLINGKSFEINRIDFISKFDATEVWKIDNQSDMDQPFHNHGTQFQILKKEKNGTKQSSQYRAWKSVVNVAAREKVKIQWAAKHCCRSKED